MQKCTYKEKNIYAFNVIGKNETINYTLEKEWKKASESNQLICDECGAPVIFRCGKVNIPHFAHKSEFQGGNPCGYSNETEEHIEGKKLLLHYMKSLYQDVYAEMRYKLPERKRADLYFKFSSGEELIIEFQRQRLSVSYWDDKREFYKKLGLNNIWFLSGRRDELEHLVREYELTFWNRMVLNDSNNIIFYLDVEQEQITLIKKMVIIDSETNELIHDNLYNKTYLLNDIKILPNGEIECNFDDNFNTERDKYVHEYFEEKKRQAEERERLKKRLEEQKNKRKEELEKKRKAELEELAKKKEEANLDAWSEIGYNKKNYIQNTYKPTPKKNYSNYKRDEEYYRDKVNKAIMGWRYGKENLVKILINCGSTEYSIIKKSFEEQISKGNTRAKNVYDEVMKLSGFN
jgi:Competence protein